MVSEFYYICTLKVFDWRPDQCDRSRLLDANYMNEWLRQKIQNRKHDSGLAYVLDNGHFTPQYDFIYGPHNVRMLDYVLQMDDGELSTDFPKLMQGFGLDKVQLEKVNALGAAERDGDTHHLDVQHLDPSSQQWIQDLYGNDFVIGGNAKAKHGWTIILPLYQNNNNNSFTKM